MTGKILTWGEQPDAHDCEPGVITSRRHERYNLPVASIGVGAEWQCDECDVIWRWSGMYWERHRPGTPAEYVIVTGTTSRTEAKS